MTRIAGVPARQSGWRVRLVHWFTRRSLAQMTGCMPEGMLEPLELFAHIPALLYAYAGLEQSAAGLKRVERRLMLLAELKTATLTHCEYCIDLGSQVARRSGLSDAHLLALPYYRSSPLFVVAGDIETLPGEGLDQTHTEVQRAGNNAASQQHACPLNVGVWQRRVRQPRVPSLHCAWRYSFAHDLSLASNVAPVPQLLYARADPRGHGNEGRGRLHQRGDEEVQV